MTGRLQTARDCYTAFETGNRELIEGCFRNTEIFGFTGDLVACTEVYFGWDLASA